MTAMAAESPRPAMNIEPHELAPYKQEAPVPDLLILAAVERAVRHHPTVVVTHATIAEHLGFERTGATTRKLQPQLEALLGDGALQRRSPGSGLKDVWWLTARGRGRLAAARRRCGLPALPESPQHRIWRHARAQASARITEFCEATVDVVEEAEDVATCAASLPTPSPSLRDLADRLHSQFRRLATATYCLHEWPEPDDACRDGRRTSTDLLTCGRGS
jgi:hypothetical protein